MNATDKVLSCLPDARKVGEGRYVARCPAHKDRSPSLSISRGDKGVLIHCHAGCDVFSVVEAMGLEVGDLFDDVDKHDEPGLPTRPWIGRQVLNGVAHDMAVALLLCKKCTKQHGLSVFDTERLERAERNIDNARRML